MSAFNPSFSATQSSDGKTITFTDLSNWTDNTEGYNIADEVRTIPLKDAFGEDIDTVEFSGVELTAEYSLDVDKWVEATFTGTGAVAFEVVDKFPFYRLFQLSFNEALKTDCGCCKAVKGMCEVDAFLSDAQFAIPIGNGIGFQNSIDAANAYLNA